MIVTTHPGLSTAGALSYHSIIYNETISIHSSAPCQNSTRGRDRHQKTFVDVLRTATFALCSPVDKCTTPYRSFIMLHWVPLPEAGAPAIMILGPWSSALITTPLLDLADRAGKSHPLRVGAACTDDLLPDTLLAPRLHATEGRGSIARSRAAAGFLLATPNQFRVAPTGCMKADASDVVGDPSGTSGRAAALMQQPIRVSAAISADTHRIRIRTCDMIVLCMRCAFTASLLSLQENTSALPRGRRQSGRDLGYRSSVFSTHCAWGCELGLQKRQMSSELVVRSPAHITKYRVSIDANGGGDSVGATGATCFFLLLSDDEYRLDHSMHACARVRDCHHLHNSSTSIYTSHLCVFFHFTTQFGFQQSCCNN